jgi:hypothetical protein
MPEYTKTVNGHFLAYIPAWRKNQPRWVMGARPPLFIISTIKYKTTKLWCTLQLRGLWFCSSPTPSLSPVSKLSLFLGLPVCRRRGRRSWARSQIIRPRESLALNKSFNTLCHIGKSYKDDIKARCFASLTIRHSNHWFGQIRQKQFLFLAEVSFRGSYLDFPLTCPIFQNTFGLTNLFKHKVPKKLVCLV